MGALIARAICKKFTVSHTLLSGRPSRVCSALCRHCAGTARTRRSVRTGGAPLSGLRARSVPEVRADPRAALPRARRPRRRRGAGGAGHRQASPRPRPPPTPATRPAPQAATSRPLVGLLPGERTVRERIGQQLLGMCPTHGPAAPNRRAGAARRAGRGAGRAATPDDPARRRIAGARGLTDDAPRSPAGRSRGSHRHDERRYGTRLTSRHARERRYRAWIDFSFNVTHPA